MSKGLDFLASQRKQFLSESIVYSPLSGEAHPLFATPGRTLFRSENEYGMTVRTLSFDFIVSADDLGCEPRRGDTIIFNNRMYEVLAPNNEPCWRWSGNDGKTYRIHTKDTGEVKHG
jgi:hypothetical protein